MSFISVCKFVRVCVCVWCLFSCEHVDICLQECVLTELLSKQFHVSIYKT